MAENYFDNSVVSTDLESDEYLEMHCEQCEKYGINKTANGFCKDCLEYMCDMCSIYHTRYLPDHIIQDSQTMPTDFCFETCEVHSSKLLKFYCQGHDKFACMLCKNSDHPGCHLHHIPAYVGKNRTEIDRLFKVNINKIDEVSKETDNKQILIHKQLLAADHLFGEANSKIKKEKEDAKKEFKIQKEKVINDFDQNMENIIETLKKEKKELVQKLEEKQQIFDTVLSDGETEAYHTIKQINKSDKAKLDLFLSEVKVIKTTLRSLKYDLEQKAKIGQKCKTLIATKKAQQEIRKLCKKQKTLDLDKGITEYEADYSVDDLMTINPKSSIMFVHTNDVPRIHHKTDHQTKQPGQHLPSIQLYTKVKKKQTKFMSLCLLSDKQLIVSDYINRNLQCFENIKNQTVSSISHELPCCPWDLTKLTNEEVAITFPDSGLIRIPTFTKSMEIEETTEFKTRKQCHGIAYSKVIDRLVVTFTNPPEVQIINKVGTVFKSLSKDSNGETLFASPMFVAASLGGGEIYISDTGNNTIFSMSIYDINVKHSYKDPDLESPLGLAVDETGAVLVCGRNSRTIHLLSPELKEVQVLLGCRDGIQRPVGVAYSKTEKKLYVAMYGCADIKVFQL